MAVEYILWHYTPSLPLAIAFCVAFSLLTAAHLFRLIQTRMRYCAPFVVGGVFEAVGYGARTVAHYNTNATMPYAIQSLLILLGPILFAASIYMILKRIVYATRAEQLTLFPAKWLTKIFVGGDITCFLVQAAGGGVLSGAKSQNTIHIGEAVILAGLVLQIVVFVVFIIVTGTFHMHLLQSPTLPAAKSVTFPWQRYLFMLYTVSTLITLRNGFRVAEYAMGSNGYLLTHEWTLYIFDAMLMTIVLSVCITWYSCGFESDQTSRRDLEMLANPEMKQ